jgi:uncharacterized protein (TIGR02145 family)
MKTKNEIWISLLTVLGFVFVLSNSCKKTEDTSPAVTDKDGNVYKTVSIGNQVWMAENLKTTKYLNGDLIGSTATTTTDISSESTPKYQWPCGGNETNVATYGRLYTWYAVTDSRNICPTGWHVPTNDEFATLMTAVGGDTIAGIKLKETGTTHWSSPNTGATNGSGFTALPGGYRGYTGDYQFIAYTGYWWTVTGYDANNAYFRGLYYNVKYDHNLTNSMKAGFTVRCLKGLPTAK